MKAIILATTWILSFALAVLTVELMNWVFWAALAAFIGCSRYLSKNGERLLREL